MLSLPVTDDAGAILGVVERAHVDDALVERATDDHLKSQGIVGGEELRSMPLGARAGRRLSWLSINIVLTTVTDMCGFFLVLGIATLALGWL